MTKTLVGTPDPEPRPETTSNTNVVWYAPPMTSNGGGSVACTLTYTYQGVDDRT